MIEINMPLHRDIVKDLVATTKYQSIEVTNVTEQGIKLLVDVVGDNEAGAKEIKAQLKAKLGPGFYFSVGAVK